MIHRAGIQTSVSLEAGGFRITAEDTAERRFYSVWAEEIDRAAILLAIEIGFDLED